jgi:hypothetical protein
MAEPCGVALQFLEQLRIRPKQLNRFLQSRWRARHERRAADLDGALVPGFLTRQRPVTDHRKTDRERFGERDRAGFCDEQVGCHHLQMDRRHVAENANPGSPTPSITKSLGQRAISSAHNGNLKRWSERPKRAERAAKSTEFTVSTSHQQDRERLMVELKELARAQEVRRS